MTNQKVTLNFWRIIVLNTPRLQLVMHLNTEQMRVQRLV
jgi:hypothetical protein